VLDQFLRHGPLDGRRTGFSVASAIFWRMRGEVQIPGTIAAGRDGNESGLRDRRVGSALSCAKSPFIL